MSGKEEKFCLYYLRGFNTTQSYMEAYGCSYKSANTNGCRLLKKADVKKKITELRRKQNNKIFVKGIDILNKIIEIAFSNIGDYVRWGIKEEYLLNDSGNPIKNEDEEFIKIKKNYVELIDSEFTDMSLVEEVSQGKDGTKIKLKDTKWAMNYLVKYFDLFPDKFKREIEEKRLKIEESRLEIVKRNNKIYDELPDLEFIDDIDEVDDEE